MNKPLFLFVGKSASGKTTIANALVEKYGYTQVESYTTRPPRFHDEPGHTFVSEVEFNNLGKLAAYTYYNNYHYGTTFQQLENSDIYVVDVPGVESLLESLKEDNRPIYIFYFHTSVYNRIRRMIHRGDSDIAIISRLLQDEKNDWLKQLYLLVSQYSNEYNKNIQLCSLDANEQLKDVLEATLSYMKKED